MNTVETPLIINQLFNNFKLNVQNVFYIMAFFFYATIILSFYLLFLFINSLFIKILHL